MSRKINMIGKKYDFYLESKTQTQDVMGGATEALENVRKFRGHISSVRGSEGIAYDKETLKATKIIYCDYFTPIDEKNYQIRFGAKILDIKYAENVDELNKNLKIYVEERE